MFSNWFSPFGSGNKKVVPDFDATFLASLYSHHGWDDTIGRGASETTDTTWQKTTNCLTLSKSPFGSAGNEPIVLPQSLKVVEMHVKKDTPFEWTDEYKEHDLERKIEAYNSVADGMEIAIHEDGINFGGQIRLNMDITKTRVVPYIDNQAKSRAKTTPTVKITDKFWPPNAMEVISINSKTTARQVIVNLFKELRIVNFPREYALYEYEQQIDETAGTVTKKLTRIADNACPLKVVLNWPIPHSGRKLVLQEKDTRDTQQTPRIYLEDIFAEAMGLTEWQVYVRSEKKFVINQN